MSFIRAESLITLCYVSWLLIFSVRFNVMQCAPLTRLTAIRILCPMRLPNAIGSFKFIFNDVAE